MVDKIKNNNLFIYKGNLFAGELKNGAKLRIFYESEGGGIKENCELPENLLQQDVDIKPDTENGKAYFLANQLYAKFKDSKLAELSKVKSLSELIGIIREYGIGENARAN